MTAKGDHAKGQTVELACHARVSWFDVRQLSATAAKTIASTIIGSMSGRRELMAALEPSAHDHYDLAGEGAVWIDYIADCGDGWNASHSVAWLVGRDALLLNEDRSATPQPRGEDCTREAALDPAPGVLKLPAGRALFLGGDEVYPTASRAGYEERLVGVMRSARFWQAGGREVFAIPGNHDWYDGLTSFVRLFCQSTQSRRWLGAWQTRQRRSYFSAALPDRWWWWGVDLALEDDFDPPQQDYFLAQAAKLQPGDQVILAVPTPIWLDRERQAAGDAPQQLGKLQLVMDAILKTGATIPMIVTGDSHFYCHHRAEDGAASRDYVVCGGGGAFTLGTVQVPERLRTADAAFMDQPVLFPDRSESAWVRWRVLGFPFINCAFSATLVAIQLVVLWLLSSRWSPPGAGEAFWFFLAGIASTAARSPGLIVWLLLIVAGFAAFGASGARGDRRIIVPAIVGALHGAVHVLTGTLLLWAALRLVERVPGAIVAVAAGLAAAYLLLGLIFGAYLVLTNVVLGMHDLEVYSAQAIERWKCFLRIRVDAEGATVYPIGLRRSSRRWNPAPGVRQTQVSRGALVTGRTLVVPDGCLRIMDPAQPLAPALIEPPFRCGRKVAAP